jgi:hypothetical protein
MKIISKALLLAALSNSSINCVDADIFKEMLTLSTSVEAQEQQNYASISDECVWLASIKCRTQIRAFTTATEDKSAKFEETKSCLWSVPCAQHVKKSARLS